MFLFYLNKEGFPTPFDEIDRGISLTRAVFRYNSFFRNLYGERLRGRIPR
jgi:hypothetical protein